MPKISHTYCCVLLTLGGDRDILLWSCITFGIHAQCNHWKENRNSRLFKQSKQFIHPVNIIEFSFFFVITTVCFSVALHYLWLQNYYTEKRLMSTVHRKVCYNKWMITFFFNSMISRVKLVMLTSKNIPYNHTPPFKKHKDIVCNIRIYVQLIFDCLGSHCQPQEVFVYTSSRYLRKKIVIIYNQVSQYLAICC